VELCRQRKTSDSSSRALWQCYQQSNLVASRGNGRRNVKFCIAKYFCSYLRVVFTCHSILRHGASGFTFPPKEGVLRILLPLKIHHLGLVLNPRILGPVASTLTVNLPRRLSKSFLLLAKLKRCQRRDDLVT
jgi:hypothetical protein